MGPCHPAKKRNVLFGGVVDHEIRKGEVIISEFFSDAYAMSLEGGRWFPVTLYADKGAGDASKGSAVAGSGGDAATGLEAGVLHTVSHFLSSTEAPLCPVPVTPCNHSAPRRRWCA